jgi:hypothetical protein
MGDTDGALDWAMGQVNFGAGSIADNETVHAGFRGAYLDGSEDGQILRYDYSFGEFGVAFSIEAQDDPDNEVDVSPFTAGTVAGAPLASLNVALTSTGAVTFYTPDEGQWSFGFFGRAVPSSVSPNGIYRVEALDFDLDGDTALDIVDGTSVAALPNTGAIFIDGIWDPTSVAGPYGTTFSGVLDTLMDIESVSSGNGFNAVDDDYPITGAFGAAPDFSADAISYVDKADVDYAIGLTYSFDTGMGELTVGGSYQQGGTIYASQLNQTIAGSTTAVASGTDLTDGFAGAGAGEVELSEQIVSAEQPEIGISAKSRTQENRQYF